MRFYVGAPSTCDLKSHPDPLRLVGERFLAINGITHA